MTCAPVHWAVFRDPTIICHNSADGEGGHCLYSPSGGSRTLQTLNLWAFESWRGIPQRVIFNIQSTWLLTTRPASRQSGQNKRSSLLKILVWRGDWEAQGLFRVWLLNICQPDDGQPTHSSVSRLSEECGVAGCDINLRYFHLLPANEWYPVIKQSLALQPPGHNWKVFNPKLIILRHILCPSDDCWCSAVLWRARYLKIYKISKMFS